MVLLPGSYKNISFVYKQLIWVPSNLCVCVCISATDIYIHIHTPLTEPLLFLQKKCHDAPTNEIFVVRNLRFSKQSLATS